LPEIPADSYLFRDAIFVSSDPLEQFVGLGVVLESLGLRVKHQLPAAKAAGDVAQVAEKGTSVSLFNVRIRPGS
jgi:hypothetical protein